MISLKKSLATLSTTFLLAGVGILPASAGDVLPAVPSVDEVIPAHPDNFAEGGMPALQDVPNIYVHEFNAAEPNTGPVNKDTVHLESVINAFTGVGRQASAHFGVEGDRVVQFVDLSDVAWAQGPGNLDGYAIETYGGQDPLTKQTTAKLIRELEEKKGAPFVIKDHESVMATLCGVHVDPAEYRHLVDNPRKPSTVPDWPWIKLTK